MECISLPEDLVEQILYRVPIKSVARWRSTSKQWNALLKSKRFLNTHCAYAPRLRLFPVPTTRRYDLTRETYVVLEMGVGDYLSPEKFNPSSIVWQIEAAMEKEDYLGEVFIRAFGADNTWSPELKSEYEGSTIEVHQYKGVKRTRLNMFIAGFLLTLNVISGPSNFLLLTENIEYMEQHPKFARFHQILLDRGFFVVLAHPQTLISQETEPDKSAIDPDQTGSEMSAYFQSVRL